MGTDIVGDAKLGGLPLGALPQRICPDEDPFPFPVLAIPWVLDRGMTSP